VGVTGVPVALTHARAGCRPVGIAVACARRVVEGGVTAARHQMHPTDCGRGEGGDVRVPWYRVVDLSLLRACHWL
jgi:hypothetical protein